MNILERHFRVWDATSSLNRILLRSPKNESEGRQTNIDITFWGVYYLDILFLLRGIQFDTPTETEVAHIVARVDQALEDEAIFVIVSQGQRYYIAAVTYVVQENTVDIFETTLS